MRLRFRLRQLVLALVLLSGLGVVAAAAGGSATVADKTEPSILAGGRGGTALPPSGRILSRLAFPSR